MFDTDKFNEFDAIVLISTTGDFMYDPSDKAVSEMCRQALADFVKGGKGLADMHAACDAYYLWPENGQILGGYFSEHQTQSKKIAVVTKIPRTRLTRHSAAKGNWRT